MRHCRMKILFMSSVLIFIGWLISAEVSFATDNENCQSAYLQAGNCVYKTFNNGRLRIRTSPDTSTNINIIANLDEGTLMTVLSGPICNSGYVFWKVRTANGIVGYVAEGDNDQHWLTPIDPVNCNYLNQKTVPTELPSDSKGKYCPLRDCACSYLRVGDFVKVSDSGPNAIRSDPDLHPADNIIYRAPSGSGMQIIEGPFCSWGWLVWKVRTDNGVEGYTPESNGKQRWLIPDESRKNFPYDAWNRPYSPWFSPTSVPPSASYPMIQNAVGNCTLLSSTPPYLATFSANEETDFSWTVRNDSGVTWTTDNYDIAYIGGTNLLKRKENIRRDFPYDVPPGGTLSFIVDAVVPSFPGIYTMTYGVVQNYEIVCSVNVTIKVEY